MLTGGEKETSFAAQVTPIGYIIDGAADIELGNFFISLVPVVIKEGTDGDHN